jgi:hypothetical protein
VQARQRDYELEEARAEIARLSEAVKHMAVNGLIELHRRVARGLRNRDHYRLRMLTGGGLAHPHPR